jgi:hypothetical protein
MTRITRLDARQMKKPRSPTPQQIKRRRMKSGKKSITQKIIIKKNKVENQNKK